MRLRYLIPALLAVWAVTGCSDKPAAAMPRPRAFHRPYPADTVRSEWTDGLNRWLMLGEATAESSEEGWLTVNYPRRGLALYITFTRARGEKLEEARANRMERLLLNSGSGSHHEREFENRYGWRIYIMKSQNMTTPFQFLATDGTETLVSGSLQVTGSRSRTDDYEEIRPDVDLVTGDILASLAQLGAK